MEIGLRLMGIYTQVINAYPSATLRTRFPQKSGHLILNFGLATLTGICARNPEIRFFSFTTLIPQHQMSRNRPPSPDREFPSQRSRTDISQTVAQVYTDPPLENGPDTSADPRIKRSEPRMYPEDDTLAHIKRVARGDRRQYRAVKNSIGSYEEETGDAALDAHYNMYIPKTAKDATWIHYDPQTLPSSFARARGAGCLLPDPLQPSTYYNIGTRSHMARRLNIWTAICNRFVWLGYLRELTSLRLVDYQLYLIASHAMSRRSGVCFVEPRLRYPEPITEDTVVGLGRTRILPPVAEISFSAPVRDLPIGRKAPIHPTRVNRRSNSVDISNFRTSRCRTAAYGSTVIREDCGC